MRGERGKRPAVRGITTRDYLKVARSAARIKKDLEKTREQKGLVRVRGHRNYSGGKYPVVIFCFAMVRIRM